jgi:hypothetical protein
MLRTLAPPRASGHRGLRRAGRAGARPRGRAAGGHLSGELSAHRRRGRQRRGARCRGAPHPGLPLSKGKPLPRLVQRAGSQPCPARSLVRPPRPTGSRGSDGRDQEPARRLARRSRSRDRGDPRQQLACPRRVRAVPADSAPTRSRANGSPGGATRTGRGAGRLFTRQAHVRSIPAHRDSGRRRLAAMAAEHLPPFREPTAEVGSEARQCSTCPRSS